MINQVFNSNLHEALLLQHQASQYVGMVGWYLLPQLDDQSNTNMRFVSGSEMLVGNPLSNGTSLGLHLSNLELYLINENDPLSDPISLIGKSKLEVFEELKLRLENIGQDTSKLLNIPNSPIPPHQLDEGGVFEIHNAEDFIENTRYRQNADFLITEISKEWEEASSVRVWPEHFDTGCIIPIAWKDQKTIIKSIGLGWAIPDEMIKEPYYYLNLWSENPVDDFLSLKALDAGQWSQAGWIGGTLTHTEIMKAKTSFEQSQMVLSFFRSGIEILKTQYS